MALSSALIVLLGVTVLAAGSFIGFESESGQLLGNVSVGSDSLASGGSYLSFNGSDTSFQPTAPYYASFFYPWYKNSATDGAYSYWQDNGNNPPNTWFSHFLPDINTSSFDPSAELYSSNDYTTFKWQMAKMKEAKQEVSIASWFGQGSKQDTAIRKYLDDFMKRPDNPYPNLRWAIYYECEGIPTSGSPNCPSATATPTADQIASDLNHIKNTMASSPYFLKVNNKPVIFVYDDNGNTELLVRWRDANQQVGNYFYIVQKVFSGYASASPQPDSWHQYGPSSSYGTHGTYASYVSPGFWKDVTDPVDGAVRLGRDINRFRTDVAKMVSDNVTWKLVETWNEWGEGSSVEPGTQTRIDSSGREVADTGAPAFGNLYIQALADLLPPLETGTTTPPPLGSIVFASGGDIGQNSTATATFGKLNTSGAEFFLALGDLDYDESSSDAAWCSYVKSSLPTLFQNPNYPFQLLTGNHEEQGGPDGYIMNHAACLPDRLSATGLYPVQYYFDYPASSPLLRTIMISPDLLVENIDYQYKVGTSQYNWLSSAIDSARSAGIPWIVVGMHKNCITAGAKSCEVGTDVINLLVNKKVDAILQGHEHSYQRSKQLAINGTTCTAISDTSYDADCVVQNVNANTYKKGSGPFILIDGIVGRSGTNYPISTSDPSYPYMNIAVANDTNRGIVKWTVTADRIDGVFLNSGGTLQDSFSIVK